MLAVIPSLVSYSAEIMAVTRREVRIVARVMAAQVAVQELSVSLQSLQVLQTPRLMRSRVIYCQSWYSRTDNVTGAVPSATAGVVGISQNEVGLRRRSQESEGPRRQNRDYDLSNRFDGRLCLPEMSPQRVHGRGFCSIRE